MTVALAGIRKLLVCALLVCALLVVTLLLLNEADAATKSPTEDGLWYYEIGGAQAVSVPANPRVTRVTLADRRNSDSVTAVPPLIRLQRSARA